MVARLERALINYMLILIEQRGFNEWYVPFMEIQNILRNWTTSQNLKKIYLK